MASKDGVGLSSDTYSSNIRFAVVSHLAWFIFPAFLSANSLVHSPVDPARCICSKKAWSVQRSEHSKEISSQGRAVNCAIGNSCETYV